MSRRVFDNGSLVEEWDDATLTYRRYSGGSLVEERTYTAGELEDIVGAGAVVVTERQMIVLDDDGSEIFRIGDMQHGDRGLQITRENGQRALVLAKAFPSSSFQTLTLLDSNGGFLLAEESLGSGLGRPWLTIPMVPVTTATTAGSVGPWGPQVDVTSGTFVTTHQAWMVRTNGWGQFRVRVAASDTTTSGEVQVIDVATGNGLGAFFQAPWVGVRSTGSTSYTELVSGGSSVQLPGSLDDRISVAVQARRTAGSGTLTVAVPEAHGWGP